MIKTSQIRNLFPLFVEQLNLICNGVTFIGSFELNAKNTLGDDLKAYMLCGKLTEQLFTQDRVSTKFNYAEFDADVDDFVYPEVKNYFTKEPLILNLHHINYQAAIDLYKKRLTSTKSPYQTPLQIDRANEVVTDFFQILEKKIGEGQPKFHELTPDFLYSRNELLDYKNTACTPYFDNGNFDSALVIQFKTVSFLILTNGAP